MNIELLKEIAGGVTPQEREELKPETVTWIACDLCDQNAKGTRAELIKRGWEIGNGWAFCPDPAHN